MDELFATNTGPPATAGDGAFERFLTAAIAAIITIMFSWRLLATEENLVGEGATGGAVGGAVGGEVPKVVMKKAIKMARAAGYTEESKALEKEKGLCDDSMVGMEDSSSGVNTVTSSDPDTQPLITCWEKTVTQDDSGEHCILRGLESDLNQGINGFSRGNPEYRDILGDEGYEPYSGDIEYADDIQPRELDSDEEIYCASMLETIMEEDSDDMCSTSTGSDVDSIGRAGEWGYLDLNIEGEETGDYTADEGCTVHVMDDGPEFISSVITVSSSVKRSYRSEDDDESSSNDEAVVCENMSDRVNVHRDTAQLSSDTADDSNSDGSDESVITVVTRQISSEKDSPVSTEEFSFHNTGQIEIVPVSTRPGDQLVEGTPVTVQSTFQALQPDEPYPIDDQHSPDSYSAIAGINMGLNTEQNTKIPDSKSPSLDSGVYSITTRVDSENRDRSLERTGEQGEKVDINSNVDINNESRAKQTNVSSASPGDSVDAGAINLESDLLNSEPQESERRLDILFDESADVPDYKDAYVSSAVEKTPKGFIFSRFELETTDYEEKLYSTDRPTHTVVAKLVAEEKFVPTEQTDPEIRDKFADLGAGAKLKTSPETFAKAGSRETDIDSEFAARQESQTVAEEHKTAERPGMSGDERPVMSGDDENLETHADDQVSVTKRLHPVSQVRPPPEKYLRMDKTDGSKSHRIVPVKKEFSVADKLMKFDTSKFRDLPKSDPATQPKRFSSLNQGESPPEKILKVGSSETNIDDPEDTQSKPSGDASERILHIAAEARETLIDDPSTFETNLLVKPVQEPMEVQRQRDGKSRETVIDDVGPFASKASLKPYQSTVTVPTRGSQETDIDSVITRPNKTGKTSEDKSKPGRGDVPKETLIGDVEVAGPKETCIDDVLPLSTTSGRVRTEMTLNIRAGGTKETIIDDVMSDIKTEKQQTVVKKKQQFSGAKETCIDDVLMRDTSTKRNQAESSVKHHVPKETLIDDVLLPEENKNFSREVETPGKILKIKSSEVRETLIDDVNVSLAKDLKKPRTETGPHETMADDRSVTTYPGTTSTVEAEEPVKYLKINTESRETLIDEVDTLSETPDSTNKRLQADPPEVHETNLDDIPQRLLTINRENIQRFQDRASLNRDGSCDDSIGNELDKSFGDVTNKSEEILHGGDINTDLDKSTNIDDVDEEGWTVDEVVQEFTLRTDPDGVTTFIPGKVEHRIIQTSPEHTSNASGSSKSSPVHSAEPSPEHKQSLASIKDNEQQMGTSRPTPKPRRSLRSEEIQQPTDVSDTERHTSPHAAAHVGPDGKLHLDAIEEVSWKPLSDSETAEKPASAMKKFVLDDIIISGSHLIPRPRRQAYSEADKSNPLVIMETGDIGSYGTRADLAHLSSDLEADAEIDFETFSGGVGIPIITDHVTRPLSESSPKQELPDVVDGNESPDESGFPSLEVRRSILEQFKRSKSVEHLRRQSWGDLEEESVFSPTSQDQATMSPEVIESPVVKPSSVISPPVIPDSPVVSPPSKAFLVSKKGSKSVPNLAGIDDSPCIHAPISHTVTSDQTKASSNVSSATSRAEAQVSRKPSRYTKKSATLTSAPIVQSSPVIKAAAKTKSSDTQLSPRQVVHTNIDDEIDAVIATERSQASIGGPSHAPVERKQQIETSFGAEIESSPVISSSPSLKFPTSPVVNESPIILSPPSKQLPKSDIRVLESPTVQHAPPVLTANSAIKGNVIEASPKISVISNTETSTEKLARGTILTNVTASPVIESSPSIPVSTLVKPSSGPDISPTMSKSPQITSTPVIPESPSVKLSQPITTSPLMPTSTVIQDSPAISTSPIIQESPVIPTSPIIQDSPAIAASPIIKDSPVIAASPVIQDSPVIPTSPSVSQAIPSSPTVSIPDSPTVSLDDSSLDDSSFRSQKKYKSLKEIKRKYSGKNFKSLQMPPTPSIGKFVVPAKAILTARHRINASRKRFLSEENLISDNRFSDQFEEHKEALVNTTKYKSPRRPDHKRPSSTSSQDSLEAFALMYPNFFLDESSEYRPSIDELHKNCIFTPEGRKEIMNKTLSIENLTLNLGAHLKRFGSVTSLVETDIDTGETSETQPFPETDLDLWFSLQEPIDRAVSMTDLRFEHPHRIGKGRFANRNVPKSKSLQTLETNIDDEEEDLKRTPSVHELRITKSLSKLNIPDWFKSSSLSKSGSCILRHGSTSTMSSWGFNPSLTSSPCPSVTPTGNVVIKTRVSPSSSMRFLKSPKYSSVPTLPKTPEERVPPKTPVKLPSEKLRKDEKPKGLQKIAIVPFAQIRAMFEAKAANQRAGKKESVRQDSVTSKISVKSVTVPVVTLSSSESHSEIVQLEGSPKRPRSPPVRPPTELITKFTTVPTKRTVSPKDNISYPQKPVSPTGTSPQRPLSPNDSGSPQRPLSPIESSSPHRPISPAGSTSPQRPLSPAGSASPQRPQSPAESMSPRSLSPLGSLNSSAEVSRSFSPSDKMRPINPDGPHNRSISPAGSLSSPRSISPGGKLSSRGVDVPDGISSPDRPSSPQSPVEAPVAKPGPRSILGPTIRFEETETLEIKDNKPPQKPGKKTDFFKRLQVFQRSSASEKDKDKKRKAEDPSKSSPKQVPVSKLKSAFEPFTRKDQASSRSIESAPTIQAPTSTPTSPTNNDPGSQSVEEAPVIRAPNSKPIENAPTYPTYRDLPEMQPIDASYRVMAPPVTRFNRDNLTNDRNSHPREDARRENKQESRASPVRVGNSGQSLPTPVLTTTPFSRNTSSEPPKRNLKETTV